MKNKILTWYRGWRLKRKLPQIVKRAVELANITSVRDIEAYVRAPEYFKQRRGFWGKA